MNDLTLAWGRARTLVGGLIKDKLPENQWVFSRTACLGNDAYTVLGEPYPRLNIQKGRVDHLVNVLNGEKPNRSRFRIFDHLARKDVWGLIEQQSNPKWVTAPKPRFILMDSYSELTDQRFVDSVSGASFFCNYGDVDKDSVQAGIIKPLGLLEEEQITNQYRAYFEAIWDLWPKTHVIFIHFPTKLESREQFVRRGKTIESAIQAISTDFPLLHSVSVPANIVDWDPDWTEGLEDFPYHYSFITYEYLAAKLDELIEAIPQQSQ